METMNNTTTSCPIARAVVNAPGFQALILLEVVISTAAVLSNTVLLAVIWRVGVFHVNLKLLLANFNFVLWVYGLGFLYKSLSTLITIWNDRVCTFAMLAFDCRVSELVVSLSNSCVNYASMVVCLERLYCTIRYKRYEATSLINRGPWIGILLLSICYAATFGHQLGLLFNIARDRSVDFCENLLSMTSAMATTSVTIVLTLEFANVFLSLGTYVYNKHQLQQATMVNRNAENLGSRFQLDQNVKVNRLLTPAMILEAICYLPTLTLLMLLARGIVLTLETRVICIHITYIFKLLFACLQPILGFVLNPQLKKSFRDSFPRLTACLTRNWTPAVAPIGGLDRSANAVDIASRHFNQSVKQWAAGPKARG